MDFAHDSGLPTLSGIVKLVQETEEDVQMRFLMFNPVYTNGKPIQTTEQRREALEGFVYSSFRVNKFMDGILGPTNQDITFRIFDSKLESENLMYDHSQIKEIKQSEINLSVNKRILIKVEQREWILEGFELNSFESFIHNIIPMLILLAGLSISSTLFFVIRMNQKKSRSIKKIGIFYHGIT